MIPTDFGLLDCGGSEFPSFPSLLILNVYYYLALYLDYELAQTLE